MVALVLLLLSVLGHLAEAGTLSIPLIGTLPFHAGLATVALIGPGRSILARWLGRGCEWRPQHGYVGEFGRW